MAPLLVSVRGIQPDQQISPRFIRRTRRPPAYLRAIPVLPFSVKPAGGIGQAVRPACTAAVAEAPLPTGSDAASDQFSSRA